MFAQFVFDNGGEQVTKEKGRFGTT